MGSVYNSAFLFREPQLGITDAMRTVIQNMDRSNHDYHMSNAVPLNNTRTVVVVVVFSP